MGVSLVSKFQEVIVDPHVEAIGFACRVLLFLEDILEDAECRGVYVKGLFGGPLLEVYGENCIHSLEESINVFGEHHGVRARTSNYRGGIPLKFVYKTILHYYLSNVHWRILPYSRTTRETGVEYFLGVLFNGRGFIVEGEENRVVIPEIPVCISAHTHPSDDPYPSEDDLRMLERLLLSRGLGHAIVAGSRTLVIYREAPLKLEDLEVLKRVQRCGDPLRILEELVVKTRIRVLYV